MYILWGYIKRGVHIKSIVQNILVVEVKILKKEKEGNFLTFLNNAG